MRALPTEAEKRLWSILRQGQLAGYRFRRQHPVASYVLDFACVSARVAIEADGGQHGENAHDARRDAFLRLQGWTVLRFWNNDILANPEGVADTILAELVGRG